MMRPNASPLARWTVRLVAGLLCLVMGLPLAATALAQQAGLTLAITGVDSKNFPTVSANLTATGSNGLPLVGLATSNFTVTEDGKAVVAGSLALDSDVSQQLNLVLAIDVSDTAADVALIKAAADDFIATLGPNDQVAVLSFYDKLDLAQNFTTDKTTLKTAIDQLTAGGNATVFNQAADKAVNMLAALPPGRKAAIMFTNSGDTANNLSPEGILANAQAATVRIYPMAFGTTVNPTLMRNWARFTGGQAYLLASAAEIRPNLLTLGVLLRQSYKLSFKSGLSADNKTHAITVGLNYQGQAGQAQASFTALPGQVQVVGPGIKNGDTVRGRVFLIADVTAPAPVKSVTFQLDGQALITLSAPPFRYDWDSAKAPPGVHTLTVQAVDQVGNQGQSQVTVNVVLPPQVAVVTATPVKAAAQATAQAAQPNPVQAFQAKALPLVGKVAAGLALLVGALVALLLWLVSLRSQRQVQEKLCAVELINEGNVRSRYELRAEDPSGMLKFEFMLNDTDLAQRVGEPVDAKTAAAAQPRALAAPAEKQPNATVAKAKDTWNKANALENEAVATVNTGSVISNWIVTVSYLLPGSLGESLRESTAGMRSTQYQVRNVVDEPGRYQRMVAAAAPPRISTNPNAPLNTGNQLPATWSKTGASTSGGNGATALQTIVAQPRPAARSGWSLTPPVDGGGSLTVQLKVRPARFPRSQHYDFQVLSRSVDGNEATPIVEHGSVALRGGPIFRRILSWVLLALAAILFVLLVWYLLTTFGLIH